MQCKPFMNVQPSSLCLAKLGLCLLAQPLFREATDTADHLLPLVKSQCTSVHVLCTTLALPCEEV